MSAAKLTPASKPAEHAPPALEQHYRAADLIKLGIVGSRDTLDDWIKNRGFPKGKLLTRRARIFSASEVQEWLDRQTKTA
jgi:predicted DNA-binding transcriptional regulator AlpA